MQQGRWEGGGRRRRCHTQNAMQPDIGQKMGLEHPETQPDPGLGLQIPECNAAGPLRQDPRMHCDRAPEQDYSSQGAARRAVCLPLQLRLVQGSGEGPGTGAAEAPGLCLGICLAGGTMRLTLLLAMAARVKLPPNYRHGIYRPGTVGEKVNNPPGRRRKKVFVEPISKEDWKVFRGDTVEILIGKDAGKQGLVNQVIRARNWVFVEGLNTHYHYIGKTADYPGMYVPTEAPLLLRQISLVDPTDRKPTEVEWRYTEEGERVRVCVRTGRIIPMPVHQRRDGVIPEQWIDGPKDTSVDDALDKTYRPSLKVFEEEIMELQGLVETRRARKSYWY